MKLFQYDKKTWDTGEVFRTWQKEEYNNIKTQQKLNKYQKPEIK